MVTSMKKITLVDNFGPFTYEWLDLIVLRLKNGSNKKIYKWETSQKGQMG